jgi:hypothetical protein
MLRAGPEAGALASDTYSRAKQTLYRLSELPPAVQGVCLSRIARGQTEAVPERAVLDDAPGQVAAGAQVARLKAHFASWQGRG